MAQFLDEEYTAIPAHNAQYLRPAGTISSDARESQSFFEREMELTCHEEDLGLDRDCPSVMCFAGTEAFVGGMQDAAGGNDRSDMSGAFSFGASGTALESQSVRARYLPGPQ